MLMLNTFQQADHPILPKANHDERSRQEFTKSFKQFIQAGCCPGCNPPIRAERRKNLPRKPAASRPTGTTCAAR
jgi:hypothetical protein